MSITIDLDEDLLREVQDRVRLTGRPIEETVTHLLRLGVHADPPPTPPHDARANPFDPSAIGRGLGGRNPEFSDDDFECIDHLLDKLEGPFRR